MSPLAVLIGLVTQSHNLVVTGEQLIGELAMLPRLQCPRLSWLDEEWAEKGYDFPEELPRVEKSFINLARRTTSYALFDAADLLSEMADERFNFPGRYLDSYPRYKQKWILERQRGITVKQQFTGDLLCVLYELMFESQPEMSWDWRGENPRLKILELTPGSLYPDVIYIPKADKAPKRRSLPD